MAYLVSTLIAEAFYLTQILSRDLDTILSGSQLNTGLSRLNALLSFKSSDGKLIPYYTVQEEILVTNQELYYFPNLILVESITYSIGPIRYAMTQMDRKGYFGTARVNNIASLPYEYRVERTTDGSNVYFYYLPSENFPIEIVGKYALLNVVLLTDLETIYDDFYIQYLQYGLAELLCHAYGIELLPQVLNKLKEFESRIRSTATFDVRNKKLSTFLLQPGINYGDVNLGVGWRPS